MEVQKRKVGRPIVYVQYTDEERKEFHRQQRFALMYRRYYCESCDRIMMFCNRGAHLRSSRHIRKLEEYNQKNISQTTIVDVSEKCQQGP
jgi:hypothetical protein